MKLHDAHGIALSGGQDTSVAAYDRALELFNGLQRDPLAVISSALQEDPDFVAGHLLQAGLMLGTFDAQLIGAAGACLRAAAACQATPNERERSLMAALQAWVQAGIDAGNRRLDRHLADHPRDLFAIQLAHMSDLMLGRSMMLSERLGRVIGAWSDADAGYTYLLGMQAFGLEENFAFAQAEALGRRAYALQPRNTWAVHAVAHVCEMSGRTDDGIRWLTDTRPGWRSQNILSVHNHWHLALFHLARGDAGAALALYDETVLPTPESLAMNLSDATAMLWRMTLAGVDVGGRWQAVAAGWQRRAAWGRTAFTDLHAALCFAAAEDRHASDALAAACTETAVQPGAGAVWRDVVLPAQRAFQAFAAGRYAACAEALLSLLPVAQPLGGSHAQRELLLLTAQAAAQRDADAALVQALRGQMQWSRHTARQHGGASHGLVAASGQAVAA